MSIRWIRSIPEQEEHARAHLICGRFPGHQVEVLYEIGVNHLTNWFEHACQRQLLAYSEIRRLRPFIEPLTPSRTVDNLQERQWINERRGEVQFASARGSIIANHKPMSETRNATPISQANQPRHDAKIPFPTCAVTGSKTLPIKTAVIHSGDKAPSGRESGSRANGLMPSRRSSYDEAAAHQLVVKHEHHRATGRPGSASIPRSLRTARAKRRRSGEPSSWQAGGRPLATSSCAAMRPAF